MTPGTSPRRQASLTRIERKVDAQGKQLKALDLNGSAAALRELAAKTPSLVALAEKADVLLLLAAAAPSLLSPEMTEMRTVSLEHMAAIRRFIAILPGILDAAAVKSEEQTFNAGLKLRLRKWLNPVKPVGALLWLVISGFLLAAGAGVYRLLFP